MLKQLAIVAALAALPLGAAASPLPAYPFVHVSADASVYRVPDIGTIDFEILAADADPELARATVETRIGEIRALLEQQGLWVQQFEPQRPKQQRSRCQQR